MVAVAEDVPRLRDGLGIPVPPGIAATFNEPATRPIDDLVLRWARTHGPFVASAIAERYGLGRAVVEGPATVSSGRAPWSPAASWICLLNACYRVMLPQSPWLPARRSAGSRAYRPSILSCQVLSLIKRRTLAGLRKSVEPVEQVAYARFLPEWQGVASSQRGTDAVLGALEQLSGYALPASAVETVVPAVANRGLLPCHAG